MNKSFIYLLNEKEYVVEITYKRIRNIHYRYKEGKFTISAPYLTSQKTIQNGLDRFGRKLVAIDMKEKPVGENYIYIFGDKKVISPTGGKLSINEITIEYSSLSTLEKKLHQFYLEYIISRVRYFEKIMNVPSYNIKIRKMTSRYGVNSKRSKTLTFALVLLHYSPSIIDSVVVHELAHILEFNHSKNFYNVVYKYYPDYQKYHQMLRKGIFHD